MHPALSFSSESLPFHATYFPMGFPLEVSADSRPALACAARMWSSFPKLFDRAAACVDIRISGGNAPRILRPSYGGEQHLFWIVVDRDNFAVADLGSGYGHICVSTEVLSDPVAFRYHFLEPLAYVLIAARHAAFVHASSVALDGRAVLLCGSSGAGKTCLAYACARRGWTFISGDAVAVVAPGEQRQIAGRPFELRFRHSARHLFPELSRFPPVLRPSGKTDLEIDPSSLNLGYTVASTAHLLVLLQRSNSPETPFVTPVSAGEARRMLQEGICFGGDSVRALHSRTLDHLAEAPAVRLHYSDPYAAEPLLRSVLGNGDY